MRTLWVPAIFLAMSLAGCLSDEPSDPLGTESGPGESPGTGVDLTRTIFWIGATEVGVCIPQSTSSCTGTSIPMGTTKWSYDGRPGATASVQATLAWDHQIPGLDDLRLDLYAVTSCGDRCTNYRFLEGVAGASPLVLDSAAHTLEGEENGFALAVDDAEALVWDPLLLDARHSREFTVEGTFSLLGQG